MGSAGVPVAEMKPERSAAVRSRETVGWSDVVVGEVPNNRSLAVRSFHALCVSGL